MVDLSLNVGMSCGPVVDLFCGAREALWRRRAILWRYVTDVPSPCSAPRGFFVVRCLADGGGLGSGGSRRQGGRGRVWALLGLWIRRGDQASRAQRSWVECIHFICGLARRCEKGEVFGALHPSSLREASFKDS